MKTITIRGQHKTDTYNYSRIGIDRHGIETWKGTNQTATSAVVFMADSETELIRYLQQECDRNPNTGKTFTLQTFMKGTR